MRSLLVEFERPLEHEFMWHSYSRLCNAVVRTARVRDAPMEAVSARSARYLR